MRFEDAAYPEAIETGSGRVDLHQSSACPSRRAGSASRPLRAPPWAIGGDSTDMRRALELSIERGKSRDAGVIYGELALASEQYEGPQSALALCRGGVEFCERRGVSEVGLAIASFAPLYLTDLGRCEEALVDTASLAERAEATGNIPAHITARSLELRLLAHRGEKAQSAAAERLAELASSTGVPWEIGFGLGAAAQHLLAAGRLERAESLLHELAQVEGVLASYSLLPELVRCAVASSGPELAARMADAFEPNTPLREHALVASRAALAEAAGDVAEASTLYAEAAERWEKFGNVPEHAYCAPRPGPLPDRSRQAGGGGASERGAPAVRLHGIRAGAG